jgi:hypothetical protein
MIYAGIGIGVGLLIGLIVANRRKKAKKSEDFTNDIYPLW